MNRLRLAVILTMLFLLSAETVPSTSAWFDSTQASPSGKDESDKQDVKPPKKTGLKSKLIHRVEPDYRELAQNMCIKGMTILVITVNEKGQVSEVKPVRTTGLYAFRVENREEQSHDATAEKLKEKHHEIYEITPNIKDLIERAIVAAVRQWRFRPTTMNGNAIPVTANLKVDFSIDDPATCGTLPWQSFLDGPGQHREASKHPHISTQN